MDDTNQVIIEAWNTVLFDKFVRFRHVLIRGLSAHSDELLGRNSYAPGDRVLDVGSGFGDTTLTLAHAVGPNGRAVGVDCADRFTDSARRAAAEQGVANVSYETRDVQTENLGGPYDAAFARFGTMFFSLPGAAMRNIRKALRPGAVFQQIVWRRREENPWLHEPELAVKQLLPVISHEETNQVHCGPGPFSMAGPDLVSGMLRAAGFERIGFERFDADICIGRDVDDAVEFAVALGPTGEIVRLAGELGEQRLPDIRASLRRVLAPFERENGVWMPSSTWFITAHNPL